MYREVIFLAKKTLELWNPSSSLILSLEKNECNENCLFIWETVIVSQPVYSFPTTWCCICIESSLKFWRAVSKRNESKYTPFFSICNFWIAMAFLKRISKWPYWAWIIVKRNSGSDISWIFPNMKFCWNVLLFVYQVLSRLSFISALGMMTRITSQVSSFQMTELLTFVVAGRQWRQNGALSQICRLFTRLSDKTVRYAGYNSSVSLSFT